MDVVLMQSVKRLKEKVNNNINDRVITFVIPGTVARGDSYIEIRFPFKGTLVNAHASCRKAGATDTTAIIKKISKKDYEEDVDSWLDCATLSIQANKKGSSDVAILNSEIDAEDYFKVSFPLTGGIQDITIEVVIDVN